MEFLVKNYSLNKIYYVSDAAINDIVLHQLKKFKNYFNDKYSISISTYGNNYAIYITIDSSIIKSLEEPQKILNKLVLLIKDKCNLLLNLLPKNIQLIIK